MDDDEELVVVAPPDEDDAAALVESLDVAASSSPALPASQAKHSANIPHMNRTPGVYRAASGPHSDSGSCR